MSLGTCNCTGAPPWPEPILPCCECGSVREDIYSGDAIVDQLGHNGPEDPLSQSVRDEATDFLEIVEGE